MTDTPRETITILSPFGSGLTSDSIEVDTSINKRTLTITFSEGCSALLTDRTKTVEGTVGDRNRQTVLDAVNAALDYHSGAQK